MCFVIPALIILFFLSVTSVTAAAEQGEPAVTVDPSQEAEIVFQELSEAYAVLGNQEKRKAYDKERRQRAGSAEREQKKAGGRAADVIIALLLTAVLVIAGLYREQVRESMVLLWISGLGAVFFWLAAIRDRETEKRSVGRGTKQLPSQTQVITEAVLLSEEDTELMVWDLYGKVSLVIGRDRKNRPVDINLKESPFAGMVDAEHAVLNYSDGSWFVEDLGSRNGLSIRKDDRRIYRLSPDSLCRVKRGGVSVLQH